MLFLHITPFKSLVFCVLVSVKMGDNKNQMLPHNQVFDVSVNMPPQGGSKCFDDDGRLKRTGKVFFSNTLYMFKHGTFMLNWY